jgi:hypothetical protein
MDSPPGPGPDPSEGERRRAFLREIASIVLGVLIALMFGAAATWVGWQIDAADARRALALELGEIIGQGEERVNARTCLEQRYDQIGAILDQAEASGRLPPVGDLGNPLFRTWSSGVWDSTIGADTASHMDRETLDNLSGAYEFVTLLRAESGVENDNWTELYTIVGPGRAIEPSEIAELRAALTRARMAHRKMLIAAMRIHQIADAFDLPYDRNTVHEYASSATPASYCGPLPRANGRGYGQAPFANAYEQIKAHPITAEAPGPARKH